MSLPRTRAITRPTARQPLQGQPLQEISGRRCPIWSAILNASAWGSIRALSLQQRGISQDKISYSMSNATQSTI